MRRHRASFRLVLLAPAAAIALAACGGTTDTRAIAPLPTANDPNGTVTDGPGGPAGPGGNPQIVKTRNGLANLHAINWDKVDVSSDDKSIRVQFYDGIEGCYGLAAVDVDYQKDRIVVSLTGGSVPNAGVCIEIAVLKAAIVKLEEAVAGRTIVDGNAQ